MELKIKICTSNTCQVIVKDETEIGGNGYVPETSSATVKGRFKYSQTTSVDLVKHNLSEGEKIYTPIITPHDPSLRSTTLSIGFDGWFEVYHIVIPNIDWFETEKAKTTGSALGLYNVVYYTDGETIFKYFNNEVSVVTAEELVEVNIEDTTISRIYKDYVSICFLTKCYISLCQQIFNNRGFSECMQKDSTNSDLSFKRDLVWMAINVIKYLTEFNQLAEAQRMIEQIGGCNGLCKTEFKRMPSSGCGCRK